MTSLALFVAVCIVLVGVANGGGSNNGLTTTTANAVQLASVNLNVTEAFDLAESGVEYTMEWLHNQSAPPANTSAFAPSLWNSTSVGSPARSVVTYTFTDATGHSVSGTFSVEVYPLSTNSGNTQKKYLIESIGTYCGVTQMVTALVAQSSFGKYCYFTDQETSSTGWVLGTGGIDGPLHTNNANSAGVAGQNPTYMLWFSSPLATGYFRYAGTDAFSCVDPTVNWYLNSWSTAQAPSSSADWAHIATGGQNSVDIGCAAVPMPPNTSLQKTASLGNATAPSGSAPSVIVPNSASVTSGGIYIHGLVDEIALSVTNSTTQNIQINQTDTTTSPATVVKTYISMNPSTNQTTYYTVKTKGSNSPVTSATTTYSGVTNGVIYCDNNVGDNIDGTNSIGNSSHGSGMTGGLHGTIADNYYDSNGNLVRQSGLTIATDTSYSLSLDGSLLTNTPRQKDSNGNFIPVTSDANYVTKAGTLGVVSNNIELIDKDSSGNALTSVELDGIFLAIGTIDCTDYGSRPIGTLTLDGSFIMGVLGPWDGFDNNGNVVGGFNQYYRYDNRLANTPPPYFPTTGNNYDIVSWTRQSATTGKLQ